MISIVLVLMFATRLQAQSIIESLPTFDRHLKTETIQEFGKQYSLNQNKVVIHNGDTLFSLIYQQIFEYPDRQIVVKYNDNSTLSYKIETKLLNDTTVVREYEDADEESVFKQISISKYNKFGKLIEDRTTNYEFDMPNKPVIVTNVYNNDTLLHKKYRHRADTLRQLDSLVYDYKNRLVQVHIFNHQYNYYELKKYSYGHLNNLLDNIKTYGQDGMLYKKITFPEANHYRPKGEILIKEYRNPEKSRLYAVETKKFVKTEYPNHSQLLIEEYYDHKLRKRNIRKYDRDGRILEKIYNHFPGKESNARKELYSYKVIEND